MPQQSSYKVYSIACRKNKQLIFAQLQIVDINKQVDVQKVGSKKMAENKNDKIKVYVGFREEPISNHEFIIETTFAFLEKKDYENCHPAGYKMYEFEINRPHIKEVEKNNLQTK